jgi:predicted RNA-binding protein with PUA-like domain
MHLLAVVKSSAMPRYWLMKSEPGVFSIDDLERAKNGTTRWDGVRNFQARNMLRDEIGVGDGVLFYHSSADPPAVAGIARVVRAGYPDPTQFDPRDAHFDRDASRDDPRWYAVDIRFETKFAREVTLPELREARPLAEMMLLRRGSRLSVQPVTAAQWKQILKMGARV